MIKFKSKDIELKRTMKAVEVLEVAYTLNTAKVILTDYNVKVADYTLSDIDKRINKIKNRFNNLNSKLKKPVDIEYFGKWDYTILD